MHLRMAGIDAQIAKIDQRERFSFTEKQLRQILPELLREDGVLGGVLLATCNRTELYLSVTADSTAFPEQLLCRYAGETENVCPMVTLSDTDAVMHLMEVACGLHSQILHEEQIVSQVKQAVTLARECHATDAILDTLFRTAVSAGKASLTNVVIPVPLSVSHEAVRMLEQAYGNLNGLVCVVVGNGKMGQLAAKLLVERGCQVFVTLRSYHHGETVVPFGTMPIPYEERFSKIDGADIVLSATRSPHYTITAEQLKALHRLPQWVLDLAMPRDVEESCRELSAVQFRDIDDFSSGTQSDTAEMLALQENAQKYATEFQTWCQFRESIPWMQTLKQLATERILHSTTMDSYRDTPMLAEIVQKTAEKTVDMLMGSMKSEITPELLQSCCEKMQERARLPAVHRRK